MSQKNNKNTLILVFDRSRFSMYQFIDLPIQEIYKSKGRSGDVAKGHHLSDNLRTTLTQPNTNTIDRCPFIKGLCSSKSKFRSTKQAAALNLSIFLVN